MSRVAKDGRCVVCQEAAAHRLQWVSSNGQCDWELCEICIVSRLAQTFQRGSDYIMDGLPVQDLSEFVSRMPLRQRCSTCGSKINEAHWHFANDPKQRPRHVKGGRAFYCDRACCPSVNCHPDTAAAWDELEDLDWDDDEELVWDDNDEAAVAGAAPEDEWDF